MSRIEAALSWRARVAMRGVGPAAAAPSVAPSPDLLTCLRHRLLGGETHYPDRPGMAELRRRVGAALPAAGYPARDPTGVLITASEGEALFVTMLGLLGPRRAALTGDPSAQAEAHPGHGEAPFAYTGNPQGHHRQLLDWMGLIQAQAGATRPPPDATQVQTSTNPVFHFRNVVREGGIPDAEVPDHKQSAPTVPQVHVTGDLLFSADGQRPRDHGPDAIAIGSLDALTAMRPFRLGFVAAEPTTLAAITKWKQASSICSPAPSQRAALWALGVRP